jgi:arylsulfatase
MLLCSVRAQAPQQKPNTLFVMGDDIGWMQVGIYHRGLALGETPNIDRIGQEGAVVPKAIGEENHHDH